MRRRPLVPRWQIYRGRQEGGRPGTLYTMHQTTGNWVVELVISCVQSSPLVSIVLLERGATFLVLWVSKGVGALWRVFIPWHGLPPPQCAWQPLPGQMDFQKGWPGSQKPQYYFLVLNVMSLATFH